MTTDELKLQAADVARALLEVSDAVPPAADLRKRFIAVRAELFQRGIFDPILSRFDTATVPRAPLLQIAERLRLIAETI